MMQRWYSLFLPRSPKAIARLAILIVLAFSILALFSWIVDIAPLKRVGPGRIGMSVITAICLIVSAGQLALLLREPPCRHKSFILLVPGILVGTVGLLNLVVHTVAIITGQESSPGGASLLSLFWAPAARMALLTAILFLIVGSALVLLAVGSRRTSGIAHALMLPAAMASYLVPLSYLLGVERLHGSLQTPVALHTGIAFCALSIAIFCARPDTWLMSVFTDDHLGGVMARRLLPAFLATPLVIGWLRLYGERTGAFKSEVGVALVALTYTFCLLWLVWKTAKSVGSTDERRRQIEEALKKYRDELELRVKERTAELQQTQERLLQQSRVLEAFFTFTITPFLFLDRDFNFLRVNDAYAKACQKEITEFQGHNHFELFPDKETEAIFRQVVETKVPYQATAKPFTFPDHPEWGITYWDWTLTPLLDASREVEFLAFSLEDVTRQKRAEDQLRQTQKMQAIGTLSGGIAHDFNNVLAAIIGFTEMVIDDVSERPDVRHKMDRVLTAAFRGRDLVRQILAFSRKTEGERKELSLTPVVQETQALLRASLPSTVQMAFVITTNDDYVRADPTQVQQVLMNLATNAAYAMREHGGQLTIGISSVIFPAGSLLPDPDMDPGPYVKLTVQDTGTGMTEEVRQRVFEPFFTTKEHGKGTGMGLAVVYGIVKSHGGAVTVQSAVGQGSVFTVFLPQVQRPEGKKEEVPASVLPTGTERILFVDDEELLVETAQSVLESLGYRVTASQEGSEAWDLFLQDPGRFDLVITDQTMPDVTGITLARRMLRVRKELPIILCTGYSDLVSADKAKEIGISGFVMKPMTRKELAETVRLVLDSGKCGQGSALIKY